METTVMELHRVKGFGFQGAALMFLAGRLGFGATNYCTFGIVGGMRLWVTWLE